MKQAKATLRYLHIAPRKVRLVADVLRGMRVREAEAELLFRSNRATEPLYKLLRSALSNARELKLNEDKLRISKIQVDQGPMLKRQMPRARGAASLIQKKMSHVFIELEEVDTLVPVAYTIPEPEKEKKDKKKTAKKTKSSKDEHAVGDEGAGEEVIDEGASDGGPQAHREDRNKDKKSKALGGFAKKIFRRKSV